ncbi:MAG: peptidoglycan bridge formation glycyltransferase FemA/FemB family protein, partial [Anaerolineae bacterium]|nr:peptidoglycan bridge formation glycyltransferase FemA/FemB family protein [Anaerolineae bacterium]
MAQSVITPSRETWDAFIAAHSNPHFLQLWNWGEQKAAYGWQVERIALAQNDQIVAGAQLLFRALPFRLGTMAYLAMGPIPPEFDATSENVELWRAIHAAARKHRAAFLKWEPGVYPAEKASVCSNRGFRPSLQTIQPPRTIIIDITSDDDVILARMNQGTRRKIRQS